MQVKQLIYQLLDMPLDAEVVALNIRSPRTEESMRDGIDLHAIRTVDQFDAEDGTERVGVYYVGQPVTPDSEFDSSD